MYRVSGGGVVNSIDMLIFIAVVFVICGSCLWYLGHNSAKIYRRMDEIKLQACHARTIEELEDAQVALQVYCARNCWHRSHSSYAREVLAYIRGRQAGIK